MEAWFIGGLAASMSRGVRLQRHLPFHLHAQCFVIKLMNKLGYASTAHWTKYLGGTPVSDALLGIKYVITKNDKLDTNLYTVAASGRGIL